MTLILVLDVFADCFDLKSCGGYRVSSCPEVFSGVVAFLALIPSRNRYGALAFQESNDRCNGKLGRYHDEHVDVIRHSMSLEDRALLLPSKFVEYASNLSPYLTEEDILTFLWYKAMWYLQSHLLWDSIGTDQTWCFVQSAHQAIPYKIPCLILFYG